MPPLSFFVTSSSSRNLAQRAMIDGWIAGLWPAISRLFIHCRWQQKTFSSTAATIASEGPYAGRCNLVWHREHREPLLSRITTGPESHRPQLLTQSPSVTTRNIPPKPLLQPIIHPQKTKHGFAVTSTLLYDQEAKPPQKSARLLRRFTKTQPSPSTGYRHDGR